VELESAACVELRRNRELNAVRAAAMPVQCGRFPTRRTRGRDYPLVLANIITPILVALMPALASHVSRGGALLCGGIHTDAEAKLVRAAALRAGLRPGRRLRLRDWNVLRFTRP
jgi:ribosomal protein L11 methylase PrmA